MKRDIIHRFSFDHPPEIVWEYLTDSNLLAQWLMPNDFKPVVGHKFQFKTKPKTRFRFDGTVYCEVLEIIPHKNWCTPGKAAFQKKNLCLTQLLAGH